MPVLLVLRSRKALVLAALGGLLLVVGGAVLRWNRTLSETARETEAGGRIGFTLGPVGVGPNPGFEAIASPARFVSAAVLDGVVYVSGAGGLTQYASGGRVWRVGLELPAAPLGPMIVARLRGAARAQLVVATAGAGVLLLDPQDSGRDVTLRQLLPANPGLRDVTAVAALASGDLLVGTRRHGVLVYDGRSLAVYRPEYGQLAITSLVADGDDLWAGTEEQGLYYTHAGVTRHFLSELPDVHVEALAAGGGRVFAGTPVGVAEFDGGRPTRTLAEGVFAHALLAEGDWLTVGSLDQGVVEAPLGAVGARAAAGPGPQALLRAPVEVGEPGEPGDRARAEQLLEIGGDVYAVRADVLYRRRGAEWGAVPGPGAAGAGEAAGGSAVAAGASALADDNIAALGFAADGRLWVGYFDRGLDIVEPPTGTRLGSVTHLEDDHLFCINRIALDPQRGTMAVGTANGLVLFDSAGRPRQVLGRRDGLISEHVNDVVFSGGEMTVATPAGLSFVRETGVESLYAFEGLVNNHVYALAVSGGQLVAGTLGGVSVLEQDAVRRNLTVANSGLRHNWITAVVPVAEGDGGGYMVGTYGAGVMRLGSDGRFEAMEGGTRAMSVNPGAMLATSGHVYAGSLGQGLWCYSRGSGRWRQVTAGLPSLNVTALAERGGELYVGTDNGLVRIAESRLGE